MSRRALAILAILLLYLLIELILKSLRAAQQSILSQQQPARINSFSLLQQGLEVIEADLAATLNSAVANLTEQSSSPRIKTLSPPIKPHRQCGGTQSHCRAFVVSMDLSLMPKAYARSTPPPNRSLRAAACIHRRALATHHAHANLRSRVDSSRHPHSTRLAPLSPPPPPTAPTPSFSLPSSDARILFTSRSSSRQA